MGEKKESAPRANQKLKLLYLLKILIENTDEDHAITMQDIMQKLAIYDITAERKSIYSDINLLRDYGYDIIGEQHERTFFYKLVSRQFELAELKLLVDAVQASKFITARKSNELIKKLEESASRYEVSCLQRQVYVQGRIKNMNESIYYNVDDIYTAIGKNVKISFQYFNWDVDGNMKLRHDGAKYVISPWVMCWSDDYYYMVGYDSNAKIMKHYRVDKMLHIEVLNDIREGKSEYEKLDVALYADRKFGMFDAKEENVELLCDNQYAGVIIDRFGKECHRIKVDDNHFRVKVKVAVNNQFLGWIMALGDGVKITGPENVLKKVNETIDRFIAQYR